MSNYEKAKKIFFDHNGNKYFMSLNGEYDTYTLYNVPYDVECNWRKELLENRETELIKAQKMPDIFDRFFSYKSIAVNLKEEEALNFMLCYIKDNISSLDTFTATNLIEITYDAVKRMLEQKKRRKFYWKLYKIAYKLNGSTPVTISDEYEEDSQNITVEKVKKRLNSVAVNCLKGAIIGS